MEDISQLKYTYEEQTEFSFLLYRFSTRFLKHMKAPRDYLSDWGGSIMEIHILTLIMDHPGISVTEAAKIWGSTSGAISQVVTKLVKKELVVRKKRPGNVKTVHLYVTERGEEIAKAHKQYNVERQKLCREALGEFTDEEIDTFYEVLRDLEKFYS